MASNLVYQRTKNKEFGMSSNTTKKMCQIGRLRRSVSKQYFICALTFLLFATYNQNGLFCNAIPPVLSSRDANVTEDVVYDSSDIITDIKDLLKDDTDIKQDVATSSSYMDHKGLFCGSRMSDLLTLNVTAR